MASPVFEMFGKLSLDKSQYDKDLSSAEQSSSSFGSKLGSVLSGAGKVAAAGLGVAVAAVTSLTKAAVSGYASYEQLKGGVETLFKSSSNTVMNYASQAYKTAGMSANQYMETATGFAASLIQSLGGDTQAAAEVADRAIIDMSDNANKMGTDISAIQTAYMGFSKQNYTMLDNLKLGYGGTKTEMERLIADASKMKDEQSALNVTVEEGNMSFANIVNAISVMQKHLDITGTTAKEASETISGSISSMKSAWDNLLVGLGDDTAEMDVLIDQFVESVVTVIGNLVPRIQQILTGIGQLVTSLVGVLAEQLPGLLETLIPPVLEAATTLFTALVEAIPQLLDLIIQQFPMIVEAIVAVVPLLVSGLMELLPELLEVGMKAIAIIIEGIASALPDLIPQAAEIVTTLVETLVNNLPAVLSAGIKLIEGLIKGIINAIPKIVAALPKVITAMTNFFTQSLPQLIQAGVQLLTALIQNLPQIISTIVAALPQIISAMVNFFASNISTIVQAGVQLLTALVQNLPTIISTIVAALPKIINAICDTLTENLPTIIQAGVELFCALIENLPQIIITIAGAIPQIISGLAAAVVDNLPNVWKIGEDLIKGIWTGIQNIGTWLWEKLKGWCGDVIGWIKGLFGIASPSKIMRDQVGKMLGEGVAQGIENSIDDVEDAAADMLGAIPDLDGKDFSMNVKRNLSDSYSNGMEIMVDRIDKIMEQFQQTIVLEMDEREFGRAVRGYV